MSTAAFTAKLPPGPRVPKLLAGLLVLSNRGLTMERLKERYGDAFTIDLPVFGRGVVISSPELVKQMFTASPDVLVFGESSPLGRVLGPGSLFSLDGERHLSERRLLLPSFHGDRMKSYEAIIEQEARREMARWQQDVEFATLPAFMRITLNSILRAVFGAEGPHQRRLAELLPRFVGLASRLTLMPWAQRDLGPLSPGGRLARLRRAYDGVIDAMIQETLADPRLEQRADVMALLLRAHYDDGSSMSRSAIADELLTLLAAGHETTATSLAWAVERLRRHPEVLARLQAEARGGGDAQDGGSEAPTGLREPPVASGALRTATIHEVQRTRPVITATSRLVAAEEFELGEWRLRKGHRVFAAANLIHSDERFFERALQFEPDRFLARKPDTYTWIPFGGGTRRCIGAAFAQMEMDVVLRTLLREFDIHTTAEPGERWHNRGVAFAPARGGRAIVSRVRRPDAVPADDAAELVAA
ncbi:MAG TPA: cytochrome P450 [Solirubrobacteraceae bacterium]|nr:cytochrome P450 [Solirubrobacteraceae bacterium]